MSKKLKSILQLKEFWPYLRLVNEIQKRIDDLDEEIINSLWEWEQKYTAMDLRRVERQILSQFISLPDNIIQEFDNITTTEDKKEE